MPVRLIALCAGMLAAAMNLAVAQGYRTDWTLEFDSESNFSLAADELGNLYVTGRSEVIPHNRLRPHVETFLMKVGASGQVLWELPTDVGRPMDATVGPDGFLYVAGFEPSAQSGNDDDAFVAKYGLDGELKWRSVLGTDTYDEARGVAVDKEGNVYITGYTNGVLVEDGSITSEDVASDVLLARYDTQGDRVWVRQFGSVIPTEESRPALEDGWRVEVDDGGNVYIAGYTSGDLFGPAIGGEDVFVAKFTPSGDEIWGAQYGSSSYDDIPALTIDPSGDLFLGGITAGEVARPANGVLDSFVQKIASEDGAIAWSRQFGAASPSATFGSDFLWAVVTDADGNVYVAGTTSGDLFGPKQAQETDAYLIKYDPEGNELWSQQFGVADWNFPNDIVVASDGSLYVIVDVRENLPTGTRRYSYLSRLVPTPEPTSAGLIVVGLSVLCWPSRRP